MFRAGCGIRLYRFLIVAFLSTFIMQSHKIFASYRGRINRTFICATKIKHISTVQIKTAVRFSLNATCYNALTTSIKERYVTSSGAMLKQRHVNKQQDDFSSVLQ